MTDFAISEIVGTDYWAWRYTDDDGVHFVEDTDGNEIFTELEKVTEEDRMKMRLRTGEYYFDAAVGNVAYFPPKTGHQAPTMYEPARVNERKDRFVYQVDGNKLQAVAVELKRARGGGGFGAARSDNPQNYHWWGNRKLGYALGLDRTKYISGFSEWSSLISALAEMKFYLTNTPPKITESNNATTGTRVNQLSEILYFKKRHREKEPFSLAPKLPEVPSIPHRSVYSRAFKVRLANDKKRKQKRLKHGSSGNREDGAKVMYYDPYFVPLQSAFLEWQKKKDKRLPATVYANFILDRQLDDKVITKELLTDKVRDANADAIMHWRRFFSALRPSIHPNKFVASKPHLFPLISTDQEWCHLYGHGDGGREIPDNFVCGTHYANTEQLAIETGQRVGRYQNLSINVTAYHLPETTLAGWIRYKIYAAAADDQTRKQHKIFDHVYDGQNESFDYNQFKILKTTVERVIADALGGDARERYTNRINARIKARNALAIKEDDNGNRWTGWGWDDEDGPAYTYEWPDHMAIGE